MYLTFALKNKKRIHKYANIIIPNVMKKVTETNFTSIYALK